MRRGLASVVVVVMAVAATAALVATTPSAAYSRAIAAPALATKPATSPTPCGTVTARWSVPRLLAQLLMLTGHFTSPATLERAAAAGVGALEMAFAPGVEPRTKPATRARVHAAIVSLVADATRAGQVAPIISADEEGGVVTRLAGLYGQLPSPRAMATSWTTSHVEQVMAARGRDMLALGIGMDTAPLYDTAAATNTLGDEGSRTFSTSPSVVAAYADAFVKGLAEAGVLAVAKEFPGEGHANADTDWGVATDPPIATLLKHDLVSFRDGIASGVPVVMVGHVTVPGLTDGLPASLSPATYTLLRSTMRFTGLVITDTLGAKAVSAAGYDEAAAAVASVRAGTDIAMVQPSTFEPALTALEHAVSAGTLSLGLVRTRVAHVLAVKHAC